MNPVKNAFARTAQFVNDHKVPIAVTVTATATAVVARKVYGGAYRIAEQFITEKGLAEEFIEYIPNKTV